jgi:molybdopterin converting factor small subunit
MHQVTISIPTRLQDYLGGESLVTVEATTPIQAMEVLAARSIELRDALFEPSGDLRKFVRIAVNGALLVPNETLDEPIGAGTQLVIILAIAGG